mmetsp:Transcript_6488/g.21018  ORF Transcript_6488/g.21018 Transcript_6488/m.21018 type:complete len:252 (+) Transcript_6488:959-1714(+)
MLYTRSGMHRTNCQASISASCWHASGAPDDERYDCIAGTERFSNEVTPANKNARSSSLATASTSASRMTLVPLVCAGAGPPSLPVAGDEMSASGAKPRPAVDPSTDPYSNRKTRTCSATLTDASSLPDTKRCLKGMDHDELGGWHTKLTNDKMSGLVYAVRLVHSCSAHRFGVGGDSPSLDDDDPSRYMDCERSTSRSRSSSVRRSTCTASAGKTSSTPMPGAHTLACGMRERDRGAASLAPPAAPAGGED